MIDTERAQQAFATLGEQLRALVDAMRPIAEQVLRDVASVCEVFAALVNTPEMRELEVARQRARSMMKSNYARRRRRRVRRG
ncbi:hypothetical protein GCM10020216_085100 [Nonomuraea helvata]